MQRFQQLVLNLPIAPAYNLQAFVETSANWEALTLIRRWPDWPARVLMLYGDAGCGKTHLAHIWKDEANAFLVTPQDVPYLSPHNAVSQNGCLVVDNYDLIEDEAWLFHVYNLVQEREGYLLLCGVKSPGQLEIALPDLKSRLRAVPAIQIQTPDETLLKGLFTKLFLERGLETTEEINDYLVNRIERSYASVHHTIKQIDDYAFALRKPLSLNLIRRFLITA